MGRTAQLDQQLHWHADSNPEAHPTNGELCARDGLQCERMVQCSRLRDMVSSTGTERFLPSTHVQADLSRLAVDRGAAHSDERKSMWFHVGCDCWGNLLLISISLWSHPAAVADQAFVRV